MRKRINRKSFREALLETLAEYSLGDRKQFIVPDGPEWIRQGIVTQEDLDDVEFVLRNPSTSKTLT